MNQADQEVAKCLMALAMMCQTNPSEIVDALTGVTFDEERAGRIREALPPADAMPPAEGDGE